MLCFAAQILDWDYYIERLGNAIQKIITIPAALQAVLWVLASVLLSHFTFVYQLVVIVIVFKILFGNNNNNDRLTAFDPGQPG